MFIISNWFFFMSSGSWVIFSCFKFLYNLQFSSRYSHHNLPSISDGRNHIALECNFFLSHQLVLSRCSFPFKTSYMAFQASQTMQEQPRRSVPRWNFLCSFQAVSCSVSAAYISVRCFLPARTLPFASSIQSRNFCSTQLRVITLKWTANFHWLSLRPNKVFPQYTWITYGLCS